MNNRPSTWPQLDFQKYRDTYQTIWRYAQIIGKIKVAHSVWMNHAWHSALYVTPVGFSTLAFDAGDGRTLSIELNLIRHKTDFVLSTGETLSVPHQSEPVARYFKHVVSALRQLKVDVHFNHKPNEVPDPIPFDEDTVHRTYLPDQAALLMQSFQRADLVLKRFRADFTGKASPVHFFWGSFDLAVTRFSGREAPEHPGHVPNLPDRVAKESYSHEVSSCGYWPGNDVYPHAAFYSYAYPEPFGFSLQTILPEGAFYHKELGEFILPLETVQRSANPEKMVMSFLESTYRAAADLGAWDEEALAPNQYLNDCREHSAVGAILPTN